MWWGVYFPISLICRGLCKVRLEMEGPPSENLRRVFLFTRSEEDGFPVAFYKAYCTEINIRQSCLSFHLLSIGFKNFFDMYFPIKAGHKMGARTKSLWAGTTSFPGLLRDYTGLPTSSSASQPSHPNWIDVHKDHFRLWTKASIWSMIRSRPVYARKECIFGYSIIQYC